ncbi:hypothetical protein MKX01_025070 [Papaver californicum]|nr:hypothetical protein MKX01_025070 [Papaver californicum]
MAATFSQSNNKCIGILGFVILNLLISLHSSRLYSIHDLLQRNGLSAGLVPKSVKLFNLDETGVLEVHLDQSCLAKFENKVYFETVIRGNLSYGKLKGLQGLSQEELFLWLPVKDIIVDDPSSGLILFDNWCIWKEERLDIQR